MGLALTPKVKFNKKTIIIIGAVLAGIGIYLLISSRAAAGNPYACSEAHATQRQGSSGSCVKHLQWYLNTRVVRTLTNSCGHIAIDGSFGPITRDRVVKYQTAQRLSADGVVGPQTWGNLHSFVGYYYYTNAYQGC